MGPSVPLFVQTLSISRKREISLLLAGPQTRPPLPEYHPLLTPVITISTRSVLNEVKGIFAEEFGVCTTGCRWFELIGTWRVKHSSGEMNVLYYVIILSITRPSAQLLSQEDNWSCNCELHFFFSLPS